MTRYIQIITFRRGIHNTGEEQTAVCKKHTSPIHLGLRGHLAGIWRLWVAFLMQNSGMVEEGTAY